MTDILHRLRRATERLTNPTRSRLAYELPDLLPPAPPVHLVGHLSAATGVGEVARNALAALQHAAQPVRCTDIEERPTLFSAYVASHLPKDLPTKINLVHVNAANTRKIYDTLGKSFFAGRINIGHWSWEMPSFPREWYGAFALYDEVWVGSRFTQSALAAVSPIPIVHMPTTVAPAMPATLTRAHFGLPDDRFVFLFMCDACSILERKNPRALIRAFRLAFGAPGRNGPLLVLKLNNLDLARRKPHLYDLSEHELDALLAELDAVGGVLIDHRYDRAETSALMNACDAYVSLHRCEGFGLTMAEAMYFGKPCIATAYSSNLDYMTPSNSYLVGFELVQLDRSHGPYAAGDFWAEADVQHAAAQMQQVFTHHDEAAARGRRAAADIRRTNGIEATGHAMQHRLQHAALRHR